MTQWEQLRTILSKQLKAPESIIDKIAVLDILTYTVEGICHRGIADILKIPLEYVQPTIVKFLYHYGFRNTLGYSPYLVYEQENKQLKNYMEHIMDLDPELELPDIHSMFRMCETYEKIKNEVNKYYGRETPEPTKL